MSANQPPKFEVGQQVVAVIERQGAYRGSGGFGGNVKSQKVYEVGSVFYVENDNWFDDGWYCRLRKVGGKGKGGQIWHREDKLQEA